MKLLTRVLYFSIAAIVLAGALYAPALADTYQLAIYNGSFGPVSISAGRTECMRRTVPPHHLAVTATWNVSIETETREKDCWQAWHPSEMVLVFSNERGDEAVVLLEKRALLHWSMRVLTERGIRPNLREAGHGVRIHLFGMTRD